MGGCMSRINKEMQAPPVRSGNWEGLAPQAFEPYVHKPHASPKQEQSDGGPVQRFETPSGIHGLTFDQAGRPVWRDPKIPSENGAQVEHVETQ